METPPQFSLWRLVLLCGVNLVVEMYISYEEIYMLPLLQRADVPTSLVSLPGTLSSAIGIVVIPLLGWASDRWPLRDRHLGQKGPFTLLTLSFLLISAIALVGVSGVLLYHNQPLDTIANNTNGTGNWAVVYDSARTFVKMNEMYNVTNWTATKHDPEEQMHIREPIFAGDIAMFMRSVSVTTEPGHASRVSSEVGSATDFYLSESNSTSNSTSDVHMSWLGILTILAFTLGEHGFDASVSTTTAYVLSTTPPSQHDSALVLSNLISAVGGCVTSLLGFLDLTSAFPQYLDMEQGQNESVSQDHYILDKGVGQSLVQAVVLLFSVIIFTACSFIVGSANLKLLSSSPAVEGHSDKDTNGTGKTAEPVRRDYGSTCSSSTSGITKWTNDKCSDAKETLSDLSENAPESTTITKGDEFSQNGAASSPKTPR